MNIEHDKALDGLNTLAVSSVARNFAAVETLSDIQQALAYAKQHDLSVKVLGGGSNVVMGKVIDGLVMHVKISSIEVISADPDAVYLKVGAGYNWHQFVMECLDNGYFGLENLALIPGSVGASPVQNIGAYGVEVGEFIKCVHGIRLSDGEVVHFSKEECEFAYRESVFKQRLNEKIVITHVEFELPTKPQVNVNYSPLNKMAEEKGVPTPKALAQWVIDLRKQKLPDPAELPNAGSFFKNPVIQKDQFEDLLAKYPNMPYFQQSQGYKVPAGWLIDQLGLKGTAFGPVCVHKHQALVLVNHGGNAEDIAFAAESIKEKVKSHYGVQLEQEPRAFS